ncbi:MAG: biopolymer transporter ExbD [Candidatus Omnitrophica bacterium]|nr:biopolymer transporter ExbD [Candidatus Omnitrophota bacterium]
MTELDFERRKKPESHLNMTPLIDMVFLLLIFFVLSSHFVSSRGFNIKLPESKQAPSQKQDKNIVFIRENGEIFLNDTMVSISNLARSLAASINKTGSRMVVIKADEKVDLGLAVKVMDAAKQAEAQNLVIATQANDGKN